MYEAFYITALTGRACKSPIEFTVIHELRHVAAVPLRVLPRKGDWCTCTMIISHIQLCMANHTHEADLLQSRVVNSELVYEP